MSTQPLLDLASDVVAKARAAGADEVTAHVGESTSTTIQRRDGKVEEATSSAGRRLSLTLLVDDRWSSHGTSDLRPEALDRFLRTAVEATRLLEPDPARRLPPAEECGRGVSEAQLDHLDPAWSRLSADDRADAAERMEQALEGVRHSDTISATAWFADGHHRTVDVTSHGFADSTTSAWFSTGGAVTLSDEGGRRPEGYASYATRYLADLPDLHRIAHEADERAREAIGSGPIASGRYPLILPGRLAGRFLGMLMGPMSGGSIHHGRSALADKLGERIGSELLHVVDDPTLPRGLGSTPWDGDLRAARPRVVIDRGVLKEHYLSTYYARKLERAPTTDGPTNWVLPVGDAPWEQVAKAHDKAVLITGFLGGNANGLTGDFSYGIRGILLENGEPSSRLSEMNVSGNLLTLFHKLVALGDDPWVYSSLRSPTLVFDDVAFSGT